MFGLRTPELLIILVVVVLLFGAKKLPQLGDSLGKAIRAFRKAGEGSGIVGDEEKEDPAKLESRDRVASTSEGQRAAAEKKG